MQSSTVASFGMLMVLEIAPEMNGCAAAIMRMWLRPRGSACRAGRRGWRSRTPDSARPSGAARLPASSPRRQKMFAASMSFFEKPIAARRSSCGSASCSGESFSTSRQKLLAERPFVEGELDVEGGGEARLDLRDLLVGEALGLQRVVVDRRARPSACRGRPRRRSIASISRSRVAERRGAPPAPRG